MPDNGGRAREGLAPARLYLAVAACATVVYLGALWNRYAMDDTVVILTNPVVHRFDGIWRAFLQPYWPVELGAKLYRPLAVASFALDWQIDGPVWFHAVNLLWHAGASVGVAVLARRWSGDAAALLAGTIFAVHPVHVEAVAYLVGRSELMACLFVLLSVYAALERQSVGWAAAALALGLLCKESAAVAPVLIVWAWVVGVRPSPGRRRFVAFAVSWAVVAVLCAGVRWSILHRYTEGGGLAPVFLGQGPVPIRLTAIAALADVARLLVLPVSLRADYSPAERTIVPSVFDARFGLGLLICIAWIALIVVAIRRRQRVAAYGLGWIGIAFLPVANLVFPIGILLAERTLYLPSAGLAIAAGAVLRDLPRPRIWQLVAVLVVAGGARTALRVPAWRDDTAVTLQMLEDSPHSYQALTRAAIRFQEARRPEEALRFFRLALASYDRDARVAVAGADAAFAAGKPFLADSLLGRAAQLCGRCAREYAFQTTVARWRGDSSVAESLAVHARLSAPGAP